ncbi:MAG: phage scaffolding protein, partial [Acutalibacteraceae bacterium]
NALKEFEGVDVKDLQGKIQKLQQDLADSDKAHKEQIAQRDFDDLLSSFAGEYKARDIKAVVPFLDTERLRSSKNQKDDLKAAFEQVKKDKAYLFEDETVPQVVSFTSGTSEKTDSANTQANNALRNLFGKG